MTRHARRAALLVVLGLAIGLGAGSAGASAANAPHAVGVSAALTPKAYLAVMQREILGPFTAFGNALGRISSSQQAIAQAPALRQRLRRLSLGLNRVAAQRAAHPRLERQRRRIVAAGRAALPALRTFVAAVARADRTALQAALPGVQAAMARFARAAVV
ncbi:MAG: hypothetical protein QOK40_1674 [Miltoncostaeaceae bacterium]|jgi:hypothetical protein|nr:hypothetical protein [Miltoncostaeaceae bacterium]